MQVSLFRPAEVLMVQYASYHRDRRNIATHFIGIPMIFTAIAVWLAFPLGRQWGAYGITGAWLMWALTSFWYLTRGDALLGVATAMVNALLVALAHHLTAQAPGWGLAAWQMGAVLFVVGWVFQFVGHYWEGRKPAFVDDLVGLLVGPMFVVGEWLMALGLLRSLRSTVESQAGSVR
jgi:uncharacterized membrane protein YGL010W